MSQVLLAYASEHGQTAEIAKRIAGVLRAAGHAVSTHDDVEASDPLPRDFDAVIVGASIHGGAHQTEIVAWARRHAITLNTIPSAFFSVCLVAADETDEARAAAHDYLDDFEERTGWVARRRMTFAGALRYRDYDFFTRLVMRVLMKRGHHPTDIGRNHDYTDWEAVHDFAHQCAVLAATTPVAAV